MKHLTPLVALVIMSSICLGNSAAGQVLVAPTRVTLTDKVRSQELSLVNSSAETQTYRISVINMKMLPDGSMKEITIPDENAPFATGLFRYSPREITLAAKEVQSVRIQSRVLGDTPNGEYRSAMKFSQIPLTETVSKPQEEAKEISIQIKVLVSVSIPIIVSHNTKPSTASITCSLLPDKSAMECKIERQGQESLYSNLIVKYQGATGKPVVLNTANGVAVYSGMAYRTIKLPLTLPPNILLTSGKTLTVELISNPENKALSTSNVIIL